MTPRPTAQLGLARVSDRCQVPGCSLEAAYRVRDVDRAVLAVTYLCNRHANEREAK